MGKMKMNIAFWQDMQIQYIRAEDTKSLENLEDIWRYMSFEALVTPQSCWLISHPHLYLDCIQFTVIPATFHIVVVRQKQSQGLKIQHGDGSSQIEKSLLLGGSYPGTSWVQCERSQQNCNWERASFQYISHHPTGNSTMYKVYLPWASRHFPVRDDDMILTGYTFTSIVSQSSNNSGWLNYKGLVTQFQHLIMVELVPADTSKIFSCSSSSPPAQLGL
jgi:hypothetical protein